VLKWGSGAKKGSVLGKQSKIGSTERGGGEKKKRCWEGIKAGLLEEDEPVEGRSTAEEGRPSEKGWKKRFSMEIDLRI